MMEEATLKKKICSIGNQIFFIFFMDTVIHASISKNKVYHFMTMSVVFYWNFTSNLIKKTPLEVNDFLPSVKVKESTTTPE